MKANSDDHYHKNLGCVTVDPGWQFHDEKMRVPTCPCTILFVEIGIHLAWLGTYQFSATVHNVHVRKVDFSTTTTVKLSLKVGKSYNENKLQLTPYPSVRHS